MSKTAASAAHGVQCRWYLADEVRLEIGGKVTIIGLFPDDSVVLEMPPDEPDPTPGQPVAIEGLTVLCIVRGFEGRHQFELALWGGDPARAVVREVTMETNSPEATLNLVSKFRPMFVESFGDKTFRLSCEELGFVSEFKFKLSRRDPSDTLVKRGEIHIGAVRSPGAADGTAAPKAEARKKRAATAKKR